MAILATVALAAVTAGAMATNPFRTAEAVLKPPSWAHPFGTDQLGRDVLARVLYGSRTGLQVAAASALGATAVGVVVGMVSGYAGGLLDDALLKLTETFEVVPRFLVALVAGALFGARLRVLIVVLALTFWPATARLARTEVLALRDHGFVMAARAVGASPWRLMARHLLPAALPPVIVTASFQAGGAILVEGGLAFVGLGDPTVVSWGRMIADSQSYLHVAWWISAFPGLAMGLAIVGMNLLGDGLDQVLDVRRSLRPSRPESAPALLVEALGGGLGHQAWAGGRPFGGQR